MPLITESFPTNGAITSGQNQTWTNFGTLAVVGNHAQATAPGSSVADNRARASAPTTATTSQFVQASVRFVAPLTGQAGAALAALYASGSDTTILFYLYSQGSGSVYKLGAYAYANGAYANINYGTDVDVTAFVNVGPTVTNLVRVEISGPSPNRLMVMYLNGTQRWSASNQDTTVYDGNTLAGFDIQLTAGADPTQISNSVQVDDWSAGDPLEVIPPIGRGKLQRFGWNANTEPDLAGYRILAGRSLGAYTLTPADVGNVLIGTYFESSDGDWHHAVIAYNTAGQISSPSAELGPLKLVTAVSAVRGG